MNPVIELTPNDFNQNMNLKNYNQYVLIKFFAPWCGHCKAMEDDYKNLAYRHNNKRKKITIAEFNCDNYKNFIDNKFNKFLNGPKIQGYPTILLYKNGKFLKEYDGNGRHVEDFENYFKKYKLIN